MKEQNRFRLERLTARYAKRVAEKAEASEGEFTRAFEEARDRVLAPIMEEFAKALREAGHDARVVLDSGPHAPSIELSLGLAGGKASRNVVGFAVIRWKGYPLQVLAYLEANPPPFDLVRYAHPSEVQAEAVEQLLIDAIEHLITCNAP
jgi:DNA-directed RNA polymerase subunit K/omega